MLAGILQKLGVVLFTLVTVCQSAGKNVRSGWICLIKKICERESNVWNLTIWKSRYKLYDEILVREEAKYNQLYSQLIHLQVEYEKLLSQFLQYGKLTPSSLEVRPERQYEPISRPSLMSSWERVRRDLEVKHARKPETTQEIDKVAPEN